MANLSSAEFKLILQPKVCSICHITSVNYLAYPKALGRKAHRLKVYLPGG